MNKRVDLGRIRKALKGRQLVGFDVSKCPSSLDNGALPTAGEGLSPRPGIRVGIRKYGASKLADSKTGTTKQARS